MKQKSNKSLFSDDINFNLSFNQLKNYENEKNNFI